MVDPYSTGTWDQARRDVVRLELWEGLHMPEKPTSETDFLRAENSNRLWIKKRKVIEEARENWEREKMERKAAEDKLLQSPHWKRIR